MTACRLALILTCLAACNGRKSPNKRHDSSNAPASPGAVAIRDSCGSLRPADLTVAGIQVDLPPDSLSLLLGAPERRNETSWTYPSLRVYFQDSRVSQIHI